MPNVPFRGLLMAAVGMSLFVATASAAERERAVQKSPPITGDAGEGLGHLDRVMLKILDDHHLPGASLAIAKDGKLLLARGYGYANVAKREPVRPTSLFNLASCTKAITGAAVLKLVDEGKLNLDDKILPRLAKARTHGGPPADPRFREITVRQLLHHAAGLSRGQGTGDAEIAKRLHVATPINLQHLAVFTMTRRLEYDPGTKSVYSNLGFLLLRLVVADAAGVPYERYTVNHVLKPMGIADMRLDLADGYAPGEVGRYVSGKRHRAGHTLRGGGCWLASTVDATRFLTSLDGTRGKRVLSKKAIDEMLAPLPSLGKGEDESHTGLGWDVVRRTEAGTLYNKNGAVAGIATFVEHLPNGVNWAVFFNGSAGGGDDLAASDAPGKPRPKGPRQAIKEAIQKTKAWPDVDLFAKYP